MIRTFDLDDYCDEHENKIKHLDSMKKKYPNLKVTLYTIPNRTSKRAMKLVENRDWIELGVHGWDHRIDEESNWNRHDAERYLQIASGLGLKKIYKAPYWKLNEATIEVLKKEKWKVFCKGEMKVRKSGIPFIDAHDVKVIHGHMHDLPSRVFGIKKTDLFVFNSKYVTSDLNNPYISSQNQHRLSHI